MTTTIITTKWIYTVNTAQKMSCKLNISAINADIKFSCSHSSLHQLQIWLTCTVLWQLHFAQCRSADLLFAWPPLLRDTNKEQNWVLPYFYGPPFWGPIRFWSRISVSWGGWRGELQRRRKTDNGLSEHRCWGDRCGTVTDGWTVDADKLYLIAR